MVRSRPSRNTVPPSYASNNSRSGGSTGSDDSQPVPGTTEQPLEIMETVPEERPNTSSEPASARPPSASARPPTRGPPSKRTKVESSSSAGMDSCTVEMGPRVSSQSASSATGLGLVFLALSTPTLMRVCCLIASQLLPNWTSIFHTRLSTTHTLAIFPGLLSQHRLLRATPAYLSDEEPDDDVADEAPAVSNSSPRYMTPVYLSDSSPVSTGT